jgi:hypothetical protein
VIIRSILDWLLCILAICDLLAHPHISIPWSLTVREEHKLKVFENSVLRKIFGPKRDGVTGGWRKLHNEELHNLYFSQV